MFNDLYGVPWIFRFYLRAIVTSQMVGKFFFFLINSAFFRGKVVYAQFLSIAPNVAGNAAPRPKDDPSLYKEEGDVQSV